MTRTLRGYVSLVTARSAAVGAVALAVGLLSVPSGAWAATTFGSSLAAEPDPEPGGCLTQGCTAIFQAPAGVASGAPVSGVLVQWSLRSSSAGRVALQLVRGDEPFVRGQVTTSVDVAPGVSTHPARLAIAAGDRLAIAGEDLPAVFTAPGSGRAPVVEHDGSWRNAEERPSDGEIDGELLVQGTIEPDADGDGYGDETQDLCVGMPVGDQVCASLTFGASGPRILPPGGGSLTQVFTVRNNSQHPIALVPLYLSRTDTGGRVIEQAAISGCTPLGRICTIDALAGGETKTVVVNHGTVEKSVTTSIRFEHQRLGRTWLLVQPPTLPARASVTTPVARLPQLRVGVTARRSTMPATASSLELSCPPTDVGPCRTRVEVRTARTPKGATRPRVLSRRTVVVAVGQRRVVRLRFNRSAMRFLRRTPTTRVRTLATRTFGTAGTVTGSAQFTLRAPRPR